MSISVNAYMKVIPPGNKNPEKPKLLSYFVEGVNAVGDRGALISDWDWKKSDVAVLQGFVHPQSKHVPHLNLRRQILQNQESTRGRTIIADANLFLYADPGNTKGYLRYSYDGIFPNTGEYCTGNVDPSRWQQIKKDLDIDLKPWRKKPGDYVLICCQRDGGWSMNGTKVINWLHPLIQQVKRNTDRPIQVRFHPGDKKVAQHMNQLRRIGHKVRYSSSSSHILDDFKNAHAVVSYNSSPGVVAGIEGVPVFVLDKERSQASDISHESLRDLENIRQFDRQSWIEKIAMSHWRLDELKSGKAWLHMRNWAIKK